MHTADARLQHHRPLRGWVLWTARWRRRHRPPPSSFRTDGRSPQPFSTTWRRHGPCGPSIRPPPPTSAGTTTTGEVCRTRRRQQLSGLRGHLRHRRLRRGGYFVPSFSNSRESIYIDLPVASQASSGVVLAHELQHVLHNAADPFENAWIDEGNADMAAFLCFGAQSSLTSHSNAWATSPELSVRWWNQRLADYGAGFLFMLYPADHLGAGQRFEPSSQTPRQEDGPSRTSPGTPSQGPPVSLVPP